MVTRQIGHFLSGYLTPPGPAAILTHRHDHNLALWQVTDQTVQLVRVWEFERLSGQKHHRWPVFSQRRLHALVTELLAGEGLAWDEIAGSWGTPGLPNYAPLRPPPGAEGLALHSLAHLYSGLRSDSRIYRDQNVLAMALDSVPDFTIDPAATDDWYVACVSRAGAATYLPVESPAPLYTACQRVFRQEPGTLMALAEGCRANIRFDAAAAVATLRLGGGVRQHAEVALPFVRHLVAEASEQLRMPDLDSRFTPQENLQSAVMKVVQTCCELIVDRNLARLARLGGPAFDESYLSMTGGFALNCPTNTRLLDRYGFLGLLSPPCANDSGQAIGLGLLGLADAGVLDRADVRLDSAYYGCDDLQLDAALDAYRPWIGQVTPFDPDRFVEDILQGPVAWVDGAAELGPRALGHRSLLADPRHERSKDRLNEVKGRQWWRPVAPLVLAEYARDWFATSRPSPFMLEAGRVLEQVRGQIPAVVHLDGTARHQTLTQDADPTLYAAVDAFRRRTGVPMVCNTSLNDRGEPIADTAADAVNFCLRKGLTVAYLGGMRVEIDTGRPTDQELPRSPHRRRWATFFADEPDLLDTTWQQWAEAGYTDAALMLLTRRPELRAEPAGVVNGLACEQAREEASFDDLAQASRRLFGPGNHFAPT